MRRDGSIYRDLERQLNTTKKIASLQQIQPVSGIPVSWFRYPNKPGWKFSMQSRSPVHPRERKKTATGQLATRYSCAVCDGSFGLGNPCHRSLSVFLCPLPSPLLALQWRPGPLRRGGLFNLSQYVDRTSVFIFSLSTSSINEVEGAVSQTDDTWYQETRKVWRFGHLGSLQ